MVFIAGTLRSVEKRTSRRRTGGGVGQWIEREPPAVKRAYRTPNAKSVYFSIDWQNRYPDTALKVPLDLGALVARHLGLAS
jgi:hypothetical protein